MKPWGPSGNLPWSAIVSLEKSNWSPYPSRKRAALPLSILYTAVVLKLLFRQGFCYQKKKNRKNRKELQQTYHYMLFSLQRYHLNFFLFIFPLSYFRGNAFTTTFQTLKEYCGRRIAFGFISGFSAWVNYLMRCVFLGSLPNLSGLLQFYLSLGITTSFQQGNQEDSWDKTFMAHNSNSLMLVPPSPRPYQWAQLQQFFLS